MSLSPPTTLPHPYPGVAEPQALRGQVPALASAAPPLPRGHVPALDGVRGLAVLIVMSGHLFGLLDTGSPRLNTLLHIPFGHTWVGVNLFFVLSGFLITGILIDAKGSAHYFRNFYARRTLRIFPLYYGVLFLFFVLLPLIPAYRESEGFAGLQSRQGWLWGYASNVRISMLDQWVFNTRLLDFGHFWSLAVEEHFYLMWPLVVFLVPTRHLAKVCVGLIFVVGLARGAWVLTHSPPGTTKVLAAYIFTPLRMDDLAMGALLAALARCDRARAALARHAKPLLLGSALFLAVNLVVPAVLHRQTLLQTAGYTAISLFFACLLSATVLFPGRPLARFFDARFLRWFGKYSYALYVFHVMIFEFFTGVGLAYYVQTFVPSFMLASLLTGFLGFGVSVLLALLSWHLYEKHFLKLKRFFEARRAGAH